MNWPGEEEFIRAFSKVKSSKEPLSATKIQLIAQNAFSDLKYYKYVVVVVEKYVQKLEEAGQVLSCLYIIDAIIKRSQTLYGAKDRFAVRFEENILEWLPKAVEVVKNSQYKDTVLKLLLAWCSKFFFSLKNLKPQIKELGPTAAQLAQIAKIPNTSLPPPKKRKDLPESQKSKLKLQKIIEASPFLALPSSPLTATSPSFFAPSSPPLSTFPSTNSSTLQPPEIPPNMCTELDALPEEVLQQILSYLDPLPDLAKLAQTSRNMQRLSRDWSLWQYLSFGKYHNVSSLYLERMFMNSNLPLLEKLDLSYCKYLSDNSLKSVTKACPNLIFLDLTACTLLTNRGLLSIAKNCPLLQKLRLCDIPATAKRSISRIYEKCLCLKSLNLRCCHQAYAFLTEITSSPPSLEKLNISCHCLQVSRASYFFEVEQINELLTRVPSLKILKAVGVIKVHGLPKSPSSQVIKSILGPKGEFTNLPLTRNDVSVRTIDLWLASANGNAATVEVFLLEPKPALEKTSVRATTPLLISSQQGHLPVVELLVNAGANIKAKDLEGNTALGVAKSLAIVKHLLAHNAVPANKWEQSIINILAIVERYPLTSDVLNSELPLRHRVLPPTRAPSDHHDTEKILDFVRQYNDKTMTECREYAFRLLGLFLANKEYLGSFITKNMPLHRRELLRATLHNDAFFTKLMPYITIDEQKVILLQLSDMYL